MSKLVIVASLLAFATPTLAASNHPGASRFAPGHEKKAGQSAKTYAPGHRRGPASELAPGDRMNDARGKK